MSSPICATEKLFEDRLRVFMPEQLQVSIRCRSRTEPPPGVHYLRVGIESSDTIIQEMGLVEEVILDSRHDASCQPRIVDNIVDVIRSIPKLPIGRFGSIPVVRVKSVKNSRPCSVWGITCSCFGLPPQVQPSSACIPQRSRDLLSVSFGLLLVVDAVHRRGCGS